MDALNNVLSIPSIKAEHPNLHADATNELEYLRAQLQEAIEALKPFAHPDLSEILSGNRSGQESIVYERNEAVLIIRDFRRAAEIIKQVTPVK